MIKEFLKKNVKNFNYGNYIVKKIHLSLVLMALVGFLYLFTETFIIAFFEIIFSLVFLHALFEAKKKFSKDFKYFLFVYGSIYFVIQLMWLSNTIIESENRMDISFLLIFVLIVIAVVFSLLLRKNTLEGKVISSNGKVTVVETEFDLRSFTKAEKHVIESEKKFSEGITVKLKIHKTLFGKKVRIV